MQNIQAASEITLESNLIEQAVHIIDFLKTVNDIPELNQLTTLRRSIYRYEKYWLPLAAGHPNEFLAPPLDVEWAWHCHMLNPQAYERDCKEIVGATVKHTMLGARQFYREQKRSQKYWLENNGVKGEPFDIDYRDPHDTVTVDEYPSKITYDIIAASKRQMDLYYQVSLPHYRDRTYLRTSFQRYKQFLYAKAKVPDAFLEPSYDIDLFWHAHQLNPHVYKNDMMRIVGHFLNHGASIDHRTVDDRLKADQQSRETWYYLYRETMPIFGAMYRGCQPAGILCQTGQIDLFSHSTKLMFENLMLYIPRFRRNITLSVWSLKDGKGAQYMFSLECQNTSRQQDAPLTWKNIGNHMFETTHESRILFLLETQIANGLKTIIGSNIANLLTLLNNSAKKGRYRRIVTYLPLGHNIRLHLAISFKEPKRGKAALILELGNYRSSSIPKDHRKFLGPIGLEQYPRGIDNYCEVATHRLRNHLWDTLFNVKTVHSRSLMTSVIQVFYENKMTAIAHLIGSDQLPLPSQVEKDKITFNSLQGERAILLKNIDGDWGIVTGRWDCLTNVRTMNSGINGSMLLRFFKFSTGQTTVVEMKKEMEKDYICNIENSEINLTTSTLYTKLDGTEISENIALAFSISLLHVLCLPLCKRRYDRRDRKAALTLRQFEPQTTNITNTAFNDMAFIKAAGIQQKTPSNDFMHAYRRDRICQMCSWGCPLEFDENDYRRAVDRDAENAKCLCKRSFGYHLKMYP